jgi:hypothetical protein
MRASLNTKGITNLSTLWGEMIKSNWPSVSLEVSIYVEYCFVKSVVRTGLSWWRVALSDVEGVVRHDYSESWMNASIIRSINKLIPLSSSLHASVFIL